MRNKTSLFKRSLAGLLTLVLVLGMIPAMSWVAKAVEGDESNVQAQAEGDFITMPITIRDFAADGMLFEYNETSKTDTQTVEESRPTIAVYNNVTFYQNEQKYDYPYVWEYASHQNASVGDFGIWQFVFVNSDGTVNRVGKGNEITNTSIPVNGRLIFAHPDAENYAYLNGITNANKADYKFGSVATFNEKTGYYLNCIKYKTFVPKDTKGFGMLYTNETDIHNYIYEWEDVGDLLNSRVEWNDFSMAEEDGYTITEEGLYKGFKYYEYPDTEYPEGYGPFTHYYPYKYIDIWEVEDGVKTNYANQMLIGGTIRTNLMQKELVDGKPIYTQDAVKWIAEYLQVAMKTPEQNADGSYNTSFVTGYAHPDLGNETLAAKIRQQVNDDPTTTADDAAKLGSYQASYDKFFDANDKFSGNLDHYSEINTWYDAAFYLMHSTWRDSAKDAEAAGSDGYGKLAPQYHSMHLVAKTNADGSVYYVFNSAYDYAVYDAQNGEIYNTQTDEIKPAVRGTGTVGDSDGNVIPYYRFDPLGPASTGGWQGYGEGSSGDTYGDMIAPNESDWAEFYDNTNYHLSLEGHAEFVYRYASNLYFTFTGDDDVYLYINGVRVLDIGGGHSVAKVTINVNDVAQRIGLQEGGTYSFDFFYMERHGTAANFGIETNIQLAQSGMITTKNGYQNGTTTGYDAPINPQDPVSYSFTLTNSGEATLENLIFEDEKLDVYLGYDDVDWGDKIDGTAGSGKPIEGGPIKNLYVYINGADGKPVQSWSGATLTDTELMGILEKGIEVGQSITIYNLRYTITQTDWNAGGNTFTNIVNTTATDSNNKELHGTADWKVRKADKVVDPFHVYNSVNIPQGKDTWQPNNVELTKVDLLQPAVNEGLNVNGANIVWCNASGNENDALWSDAYKNVIKNIPGDINSSGSLNYNSKKPGMETVYYKVKGINYNDLIYHFDVITYGVADNVYVLDYGLNVELNCDQYGFRVNDHLSVPQNIYEAEMTKTMDVHEDEGRYGHFVTKGRSLALDKSVEYQPFDIIDGCDSMTVIFYFVEEGVAENERSKFNSVEMRQNVSTAPANVVYYEENHPGITYVNTDENNWIHYETMAPVMEQAKDEEGNPIFEPAFDDDGNPIYQQEVDVNGEPVFDDDGNPIYQQEVDVNGEPVVDDDGNPVYVQVMVPVMVEKKDEDDNVIYESTAGTNQSPDQDLNYGYDPNYEQDKVGTLESDDGSVENVLSLDLDTSDLNAAQKLGIAALNAHFGLGGGDSNGTVNKLEVKQTADVMSFEFKGTGFEIISRTTAGDYAIINVQVMRDTDGDGTYEKLVGYKPVITESKGGDLYQIPIISITGMERGNYKVTVKAAGSTDSVNRVLYIDGIRIYGPLANSDLELKYYNPDEYKAEIHEVKQLIQDGNVIYADLLETGRGPAFVSGYIMVENTGEGSVLTAVENRDDYLSVGPNNELYMDGNSAVSVIAFKLKPIKDWPEEERTLQIGAHRKADSFTPDMSAAALAYSDDYKVLMACADQYREEGTVDNTNGYIIASGTEMYYNIDVDSLTPLNDGSYLVMIASIGSEWGINSMALTNIKISGYEIYSTETSLQAAAENGTLDEEPLVQQTFGLLRSIGELLNQEPEIEQEPVNENLYINAAVQSATKVATGRTVTLTIKADAEAQELVVTDGKGNEVTPFKSARKVSGDVATFTFMIKVTGSSGQVLNYTARVYDANDLASVNAETFTVTIR